MTAASSAEMALNQLLVSSEENEEGDIDVVQCCSVLSTHLLQSVRSQSLSRSTRNHNLRDVLGERVSQLHSSVIPLLQDRVDLPQLLPATQDVAGEQEVLDENIPSAQTLTRTALQAAHLYALVLCHNGSLGTGWVDLEGLTALSSVLQRWSKECCGREAELSTKSNASGKLASLTMNSPPKKRSRRNEQQEQEQHFETEDEGYDTPLLALGANVARAVCRIPASKEFVSSWKPEAQENLWEAWAVATRTLAALRDFSPEFSVDAVEPSTALIESIQHACSSENKADQHQLVVAMCRGLLKTLQFTEHLPNGFKGKLHAHEHAAEILRDIMEAYQRLSMNTYHASDSPNLQSIIDKENATPRRSRKSSTLGGLSSTTPTITTTAKKQRRRSTIGSAGASVLSPAALKSRRFSIGSVISTTPATAKSPGPVWSVFVSLMQKLATTTPGLERHSLRTPVVDTLARCLPALPLSERTHFLKTIVKLSKSKIALHRLLICELLGSVLTSDWIGTHQDDFIQNRNAHDASNSPQRVETDSSCSNCQAVALPFALWTALQGRLVDKLAAVRARAAASMEKIVACLASNANNRCKQPDWFNPNLMLQLRKRTFDETATVRKAAILTMTEICLQQENLLNESVIATLTDLLGNDSSLLVRKSAAESITRLLQHFLVHPDYGNLLEHAWSACVLPLVFDDEIAAKAVSSFRQLVLEALLDKNPSSAWRLLAQVSTSTTSRLALLKAVQQITLQDADLTTQVWIYSFKCAYETVRDPEMPETQIMGVWCLLEAYLQSTESAAVRQSMVTYLKRNSYLEALCQDSWRYLLKKCQQSPQVWLYGTLRSCWTVVSQVARGLKAEAATNVREELAEELSRLQCPPQVIGAAVSALSTMSCRPAEQARKVCAEWIRTSYLTCEEELVRAVMSMDTLESPKLAIRALFCIGELSMVGFRSDDDENRNESLAEKMDDDPLRGMYEQPSRRLQDLVQALLSPTLPNSCQPTPISLRAHAFTVLGKLCLRQESLAKKSLILLARELHPCAPDSHPAIQSNALLVLGDLCVRYTNMADRYLPVMASCLQAGTTDPEKMSILENSNAMAPVTRKHAVLLLSSLLLQDYIKWRGLLFHRFLVACSDENEEVASLAESVLSGPLSTRYPKLFFNHFVEALFVLNKCTAHPIYISAASQGDGGSGIAVGFEGIYLNGEMGKIRRRRMYEFLLSKLSDEEKIGVTARLAKEVLGEAAGSTQGGLARVCTTTKVSNLSPKLLSAWNVLTDCFYILTLPSIKVGSRVQEEDTSLEDPNLLPNASRHVTVAKGRLLSKISRKHLIEIVLPILCQLKTKLAGSPLLKDLSAYLLTIFKSYKVEVKEFLANDPVLLQELEYDARQYHES